MHWKSHDAGSQSKIRAAINPIVIDAGTTTEDGVELSSSAFDRRVPGGDYSDLYLSAKVGIPYYATLTAGNTATITSNCQHSSLSSAGWTDFNDKDGSTANSVTIGTTGSTAAQTITGVLEYDVDLGSAKRYFRVQVTPTLSGTSTESDDVDLAGVVVLGGGDQPPAS